jgi:hypothetical protein
MSLLTPQEVACLTHLSCFRKFSGMFGILPCLASCWSLERSSHPNYRKQESTQGPRRAPRSFSQSHQHTDARSVHLRLHISCRRSLQRWRSSSSRPSWRSQIAAANSTTPWASNRTECACSTKPIGKRFGLRCFLGGTTIRYSPPKAARMLIEL